jgi:hypothetical protein
MFNDKLLTKITSQIMMTHKSFLAKFSDASHTNRGEKVVAAKIMQGNLFSTFNFEMMNEGGICMTFV